MNELYELVRNKSMYKNLLNNMEKIYNILSSNTLIDDLSSSSSYLQNNCIINGESKRAKEIDNIKNSVINSKNNVYEIIRDINLKINDLNDDIGELNNNG